MQAVTLQPAGGDQCVGTAVINHNVLHCSEGFAVWRTILRCHNVIHATFSLTSVFSEPLPDTATIVQSHRSRI